MFSTLRCIVQPVLFVVLFLVINFFLRLFTAEWNLAAVRSVGDSLASIDRIWLFSAFLAEMFSISTGVFDELFVDGVLTGMKTSRKSKQKDSSKRKNEENKSGNLADAAHEE